MKLIVLLLTLSYSIGFSAEGGGCNGVPGMIEEDKKSEGILYLEQNNFSRVREAAIAARNNEPEIKLTAYDLCYVFVTNPSELINQAKENKGNKEEIPVKECKKNTLGDKCIGWEVSAGPRGDGIRYLQGLNKNKEDIVQALESARVSGQQLSWGDVQRHYYNLDSPANTFEQQANNLSNNLLGCINSVDPDCLDAPTEGMVFLKEKMPEDADAAIRLAIQQNQYLGSGDMKAFYTPSEKDGKSIYEELKSSGSGCQDCN